MDVLSEILLIAEPQSYHCGGMDFGVSTSLSLPAYKGMKCYAVVSGELWIRHQEGQVHLQAGDCVLLTAGQPFQLFGSQRSVSVKDGASTPVQCGTIATYDEGGQCLLVGAHFIFSNVLALELLSSLPPLVRLPASDKSQPICWTLQQMAQELQEPQLGGVVIAHALARMMLVQALRVSSESDDSIRFGSLAALSDLQIGEAIRLMHDDPGSDWTVGELARQVGMSRAAFAMRFHSVVRSTPMAYLTTWRMALAQNSLRRQNESIKAIAGSLSYRSVSAFGRVFARTTGSSPKRYRLMERSQR